MAETDVKGVLMRLRDSGLVIPDPNQDVRGFRVVDQSGEEIGRVDDLVIDIEEKKVRFLEVSEGGFLGFRATKIMIPVEAIAGISRTEEKVYIDRTRKHVVDAPSYDPELIESEYWSDVYAYYGVAPFWSPATCIPGR
jgi:sporulation protein YlmC with PRC-barrel domain